jgi:hypothetical protein
VLSGRAAADRGPRARRAATGDRGFTSDTPWTENAAITKPYAETKDPEGKRKKLVMAAPMGENAFLFALEKFLLGKDLL